MKKSRFILLIAVAVAALALSFPLHRRAAATIHQNENSLRQQQEEIERVTAENRDLSNGAAQTHQTADSNAGVVDYTGELAKLRAEAAALRGQQLQLSNQQWTARLSAGVQLLSTGNFVLSDHNKTLEASMAGGPRPGRDKLNDALGVAEALRKYADEHEGQFPTAIDQALGNLPHPLSSNSSDWANAAVKGANDFEIVYQGGTNDLGNIPARRVALIRERQPWLTPDGKWARTYGYVDGMAEVVTSDDNFQSWDAVHVVPPLVSP